MEIEEVYKELTKELVCSKILKGESMKKHTTFKIGGEADLYIKANSIEDIKKVFSYVKQKQIPLTVLGNGSNVLVKDNGIRGIVLSMEMQNYEIEKNEENILVTCDAGVKLAFLARVLYKEEIEGFEFASGIPGTIGGAIKMNAGAHGREMKDIVKLVTYMDFDGNIKILSNEELNFDYRSSIFKNKIGIILQIVLELKNGSKEEIQKKMDEYKQYRKEKQPINYPSAGSTFKRGNDFITAKLIDECGLKGYKIGGAMISDLHAGFIINEDNATAEQVLELIDYTKKQVKEKTGKQIELEIEILGE